MNLEQQKKQARELLRGVRAGEPAALERVRRGQPRWQAFNDAALGREVALHDALYLAAREQGFSSWTKLKAHVEARADERRSRLYVADLHWIAERAAGLVRVRRSAGPAALEQIRVWHPRFADCTDEEILAGEFSEADARLVYARQHGFDTWGELASRVAALTGVDGEPFFAAFRALAADDFRQFAECLARRPALAAERGTNGNTLLNLAVSLGRSPAVESLLKAGAPVNDANDRGWTPLHQAAYRNDAPMITTLLEHGADPEAEAHGAGGTPLIVALFWGHQEAADALASVSLAPENLRVAAGVGRAGLIKECFRSDGTLTQQAAAGRGFYRPHSGFPDWAPSAERQEILDEALVWAAKAGRVEAMPTLLDAGARLDADPYRGTPLIWAAVKDRREAAEWLIAHGAPVNQKATFGGLTHGQGITALHMAAQNGHLAMVQLLVAHGADRTLRDDLYGADAAGAANFFGHPAVRDWLKASTSPTPAP